VITTCQALYDVTMFVNENYKCQQLFSALMGVTALQFMYFHFQVIIFIYHVTVLTKHLTHIFYFRGPSPQQENLERWHHFHPQRKPRKQRCLPV